MWSVRVGAIAVLSALALGSAIGRSDDGSKPPPPPSPPAAGFLEFLGSVDRLSEVNPNYLAPPKPVKVSKPASSGPPPPPPPPPTASQSGDKNDG